MSLHIQYLYVFYTDNILYFIINFNNHKAIQYKEYYNAL